MKTKHLLLLSLMLTLTALTVVAQDATDKKPSADNIPFGKKLPPPDLTNNAVNSSQQVMQQPDLNKLLKRAIKSYDKNAIKKILDDYRQQLKNQATQALHTQANNTNTNSASSNSNFHLVKDINALAESNPHNLPMIRIDIHWNGGNDSASYAVLDNVAYFVADDGIHGSELWRSDGTAAGTYMVKDIAPGVNSSFIFEITAVDGKIYFSNYDFTGSGWGVWTSDGTESGTQLLISLGEPREYFKMGNKVYFITDDDIGDQWSVIWETNGTTAGTKRVITLENTGAWISEPTVVNGLFFFTMYSYESPYGWNLWRSDGTETGTYSVAAFPYYDDIPAQFTNYNHKLYFSANDGSGRKLWVSDGTDAGTKPAPGNHDVVVNADKLETTFPILNNVLYIPGEKTLRGNGLYKYDASNAEGLVKIKDLAPVGDTAFIVPLEMQTVNNTLYFKVTNYTGGVHDELWSSKGTRESTQRVYKLLSGESIKYLYNGSGIFYFVKYDKILGTELWRTYETSSGIFPLPVSDIFKGPTSSYPAYLTAFNGKLIFSAADEKKGNELFITGGDFFNTALVKDINTVATTTSDAGFNFYGYNGMVSLGKDVLFNAYERVHGRELYKSDGTAAGTGLLSDVIPGEAGFYINEFLSKNNAAYFIAINSGNQSIYKTNGTKNSLRKITSDYSYIQSFGVTDDGLVFYVVYNYDSYAYELWCTDGTASGTHLLSSTLYSANYLNVIHNTALFVAGDAVNGYELWKSDGSVAGTKMVKDINPGTANSSPKGMFVYKNEVYFAANNGTGASFWKSDGTKGGTIQLRQIDLWYHSTVFSTERYDFEVSNNILYFSAINYANSKGTEIWRTDGTKVGTYPVTDISPDADSYYPVPNRFKDVNGVLFFIGDDGVHGAELWKTDGTKEGTMMVKDITPGIAASNINGLTSLGGKLYFQNAETKEDGVSRYYLWSSDGTAEGTTEVGDFGISNIAAILAAGDKLFLTVYTQQYGAELYAGKADETGKFVASKIATEDAVKTSLPFNAVLYPNPVKNMLNIKIAAGNSKNVTLLITDVSGKTMLAKSTVAGKGEAITQLDVSRLLAGTYFVKIIDTDGSENAMMKFVKQ